MTTTAESLSRGHSLFAAGALIEAELAYRAVLAAEPHHALAMHQLGLLALQSQRIDEGIALLERATANAPLEAGFHGNLGEAYRLGGRLTEAERSLRQALALRPDLPQAHAMLASVLESQGRLSEAADCLRLAADANSQSADAWFDLGRVLHRLNDQDATKSAYRAALALDAGHLPARINLGTLAKQRGQLDAAREHFLAALQVSPNDPSARTKLGQVYELQQLPDEALAAYRAAIAADARHVQSRLQLARLLESQGHWQAALTECQQLLQVDPHNARAHLLSGLLYNQLGQPDEAIAACSRALDLEPTLSVAHGNLGIAWHARGRADEALSHFRQAVALDPSSSVQHSNLLYALNFVELPPEEIFAEHRRWAERHADPLTTAAEPHARATKAARRLRVGYVSPHFFDHAVNFFVEPILAAHDHGQLEVVCYSDVAREDATTARLKAYADHWRNIVGRSHAEVAAAIRQDQIDILVDLTGHIGENRLPVFARKPAPIQVTYIGYQNTTGMQAMDYRLTDDYADPPGATEAFHTERLLRLPNAFFCYLPSHDAPAVGALPAVERGYVTFGSFNKFAKATPKALTAWIEILRRIDRSRLLVLADTSDALRRDLHARLANAGIDRERLILKSRAPRTDYLQLIASVDVALDPFPFNGHTTTCDCLWQGVPVVTLAGATYVSRFGSSAHRVLGLMDWVAESPAAYIDIATRAADNLERLSALRRDLRPRMAASPLVDFVTFTRNLEQTYRRIWDEYCLP